MQELYLSDNCNALLEEKNQGGANREVCLKSPAWNDYSTYIFTNKSNTSKKAIEDTDNTLFLSLFEDLKNTEEEQSPNKRSSIDTVSSATTCTSIQSCFQQSECKSHSSPNIFENNSHYYPSYNNQFNQWSYQANNYHVNRINNCNNMQPSMSNMPMQGYYYMNPMMNLTNANFGHQYTSCKDRVFPTNQSGNQGMQMLNMNMNMKMNYNYQMSNSAKKKMMNNYLNWGNNQFAASQLNIQEQKKFLKKEKSKFNQAMKNSDGTNFHKKKKINKKKLKDKENANNNTMKINTSNLQQLQLTNNCYFPCNYEKVASRS